MSPEGASPHNGFAYYYDKASQQTLKRITTKLVGEEIFKSPEKCEYLMLPKKLITEVLALNHVENHVGVQKKIDSMLSTLRVLIKKSGYSATIVLGGSAAKGTLVGNQFDCDIFVRFNKKHKDQDLSELLSKALGPLKTKRVHGSRDYFQIPGTPQFEIIPVLNIQSPDQALNVTDASPLHVEWVTAQIQKLKKKNIDLRKEIILTKIFCKSQGVYGAESYIRGFSGHVLDILVTYYGGFEKLLLASRKWKEGLIIDISKHGKVINKSKLISPLIVVDPIQPDRNASASLSTEQYELFITRAKEFLKHPNSEFFVKKTPTLTELTNEHNTIILKIKLKLDKDDIMGAKIVKALSYIVDHLQEYGIKKKGYLWDKGTVAYLYVQCKKNKLSDTYEHIGPPLFAKIHVEEFRKKHPHAIVKKNRLYADVRRPETNLWRFVEQLLQDNYLADKALSIAYKNKPSHHQ